MAADFDQLFGYEVAVTLHNGDKVACGVLAARVVGTPQSHKITSEFSYDAAYRSHAKRFALDPYALYLEKDGVPKDYHAFSDGIPNVLEDALPDAWGRAILAKEHNLAPVDCNPASLLRHLRNPLGALSFSLIGVPARKTALQNIAIPFLSDLEGIEQKIEQWEARNLSREVIEAIRAGSSLGGARPKILVNDEGAGWIAKFPSKEDDFDVVRTEFLCLSIAEQSCVPVPEHRLVEINRKPVLLVRRFDETPEGGRNHVVSMRTLMHGKNVPASYVGLSEIVRDLSYDVAEDGGRLFRWMLVNIVVGNIDDHLKNFAMIHDRIGWRLSPAYDITPAALANDGHGALDHSINFDSSSRVPSRDELIAIGRSMGLTANQVKVCMECVFDSVRGLPELMSVLDNRNGSRFRELFLRNLGRFR